MGVYLRKGIKLSKNTRLNISKSGLGISTGIPGARVGVNSKGAYVSGGKDGIYYREQLKSNSSNKDKDIDAIAKKITNTIVAICFIFVIVVLCFIVKILI